MDKLRTTNLAQQLLDGEFIQFNHNPLEYCLSLGWDKNGKSTKKAIAKKDELAPSAQDELNLSKIIQSLNTEDVLDICENGKVSDFLVNCVAEHINQ